MNKLFALALIFVGFHANAERLLVCGPVTLYTDRAVQSANVPVTYEYEGFWGKKTFTWWGTTEKLAGQDQYFATMDLLPGGSLALETKQIWGDVVADITINDGETVKTESSVPCQYKN